MGNSDHVLAVMNEYPEVLDFASLHYGEWVANGRGGFVASPHVMDYLKKAREARAAVADLIEAVDKHLFAIRQMDEAMNDGINVQGAVSAAIGTEEMLRSAVNRVKGA